MAEAFVLAVSQSALLLFHVPSLVMWQHILRDLFPHALLCSRIAGLPYMVSGS